MFCIGGMEFELKVDGVILCSVKLLVDVFDLMFIGNMMIE